MSERTLAILGAPTSASAHWPGQEMAPTAFRKAGLIERFQATGARVVDLGDLPIEPWRVARQPVNGGSVNNLDRVIAFAELVRESVCTAARDGAFPIVLGGDCTITVGTMAGRLAAEQDPALVYVDGGWDLSSPAMYPAGILDSMGVGHMLDRPGETGLAGIAPRRPMANMDRFVQFGHGPGASDGPEETLAEELALHHVSGMDARDRGADAACDALSLLPADTSGYLLHFDVDVIEFFDVPVADVPLHGNGLPYADTFAALRVLVGDPRCVGLTVTEFNPDHAKADPEINPRFVADLADLFAG